MTLLRCFPRFAIPALAFGVLAVGCGGAPTDETPASSGSDLTRPNESTTYTATSLAPPFAGCAAPQLLTVTVFTTSSESLIATCPSGAAANAWVVAHPTLSPSLSSTRPSGNLMVTAPAGDVFLDFMPPAPTTLPSQDNTDTPPVYFAESNIPVDAASPVPCTTMFFSVPKDTPVLGGISFNDYAWVAYCVETPAVDALAAQLAVGNVANGTGNLIYRNFGEGPTAGPADMPRAAYGYVYLYGYEDKEHGPIGGGCSSGCFWQ